MYCIYILCLIQLIKIHYGFARQFCIEMASVKILHAKKIMKTFLYKILKAL